MNKPAKELALESEETPTQEQALQTISITPMQMINAAVESGKDLAYVERLMELERTWKADKAREAFYVALAEFKKNPVHIIKDKKNAQYGSSYAGIGNIVNTTNATMAPFGLNARWDIQQGDVITVTCILSHTLGHSESVPMSGLPDESGKKNPLQQIKSTITYLKVSTFEAVTGVVSVDYEDDDGNGAGADPIKMIAEKQALDLEAKITETGASKGALLRYYKILQLEDLPASDFNGAIKALEDRQKQAKK